MGASSHERKIKSAQRAARDHRHTPPPPLVSLSPSSRLTGQMAVPPSLPPRTQLERNRFRYHLPLSTLYPRRFSTFLHLIPSPTAPSLVAPLIKCEIPLGVLSPFISFQSADPLPPVCLFLDLEEKERERDIYIYLFPFLPPFLTLRHVLLSPPSFPPGRKQGVRGSTWILPPSLRARKTFTIFV